MNDFNILIKLPSRSRPEQCKSALDDALSMASRPDRIKTLVTLDSTDPHLGTYRRMLHDDKLVIDVGFSIGKINACNRGMEKTNERLWETVLLLSDDMRCTENGWDDMIEDAIRDDTDKMIWSPDGFQDRICTLALYGRKYYERFRHLYHPEYRSLWCDNEATDVALMLDKCERLPSMFRHEHYSNDPRYKADALMKRNEAYYKQDEQVYLRRKSKNFDLIKTETGWTTQNQS